MALCLLPAPAFASDTGASGEPPLRRSFGWGAVGAGAATVGVGALMATSVIGSENPRYGHTCLGSPCGPSGGIQIVAGALLAGAGALIALDHDPAVGWLEQHLRISARPTFLYGPFSGDSGPWLELGPTFEVGSSGSFYLHAEPTLVFGRVSRSKQEGVGSALTPTVVTVDEATTIVGTVTRLQGGVGFGPVTLRAGPEVGYAVGWFNADACGRSSYNQPLFGASGTVGARFGSRRELEVAFLVDAMSVDYPVCRTKLIGNDPLTAQSVLEIGPAENVGLFMGATADYAF